MIHVSIFALLRSYIKKRSIVVLTRFEKSIFWKKTMKFLIILILLCLRSTEIAGFLSGPVNAISTSMNRNLTCSMLVTLSYNSGTTAYAYANGYTSNGSIPNATIYFSGGDYCIVYQITQPLNGFLAVQTVWTMTSYVNEYRNTAIKRWVLNRQEEKFRYYNKCST